jgi:hypothetical protein
MEPASPKEAGMHMKKGVDLHDPRVLFFGVFYLFWTVFCAAATTCFLCAVNRIAGSMRAGVSLKALKQLGDEFTDEERRLVVARLKKKALKV